LPTIYRDKDGKTDPLQGVWKWKIEGEYGTALQNGGGIILLNRDQAGNYSGSSIVESPVNKAVAPGMKGIITKVPFESITVNPKTGLMLLSWKNKSDSGYAETYAELNLNTGILKGKSKSVINRGKDPLNISYNWHATKIK
jgi:hypothetical protein